MIFSAAGSTAAQTLSAVCPLLWLPRLKKVDLPKARPLLGIMISSDLWTRVQVLGTLALHRQLQVTFPLQHSLRAAWSIHWNQQLRPTFLLSRSYCFLSLPQELSKDHSNKFLNTNLSQILLLIQGLWSLTCTGKQTKTLCASLYCSFALLWFWSWTYNIFEICLYYWNKYFLI